MMRHAGTAFVLGIVPLLLAACGASVQEGVRADKAALQGGPFSVQVANVSSSTDKIPSHVVQMLKGHLEQGLKEKGLVREQQRQLALRVDVKDYRDRGAVSRFMLGVLAGSDNMTSAVEVVDPQDNRVVATSTVKSYNATAIGDMDLVARLHAEEIVKYLQTVLGPGGRN